MIWNRMNAQIDWGGLEFLIELFGVPDAELLIEHLYLIQQQQAEQTGSE